MPKIRLAVYTGFAGAEHTDVIDYPDDEWDDMDDEQREKTLDEMAQDFMNNVIECSAIVIEDE